MGTDRTDELSREELVALVDATRAMARASSAPDFDQMMDDVLRVALETTNSDRTGVYMLEEGSDDTLVLVGRLPRAEATTIRRLSLSKTPMRDPMRMSTPWTLRAEELGILAEPHRTEGITQIALVPITTHGKTRACLNLSRMEDRPYDQRELRFALILGELLCVYVENVRLYSAAHGRLAETRMLLDVGREVSATLELDKRLMVAAEVVARLVDASNGFILLLEDDGKVLHGVATSNAERREEFRSVRIPLSSPSIAARAVLTRSAVIVDDAEHDHELRRELVDRFGEKSILAIPMIVNDEAIGAIVVDDTRHIRSWSRSETERAELIAQNVAAAIANARLYDEVRRRSMELERAQQELVKRERLAALGQLAAIMAHEVRNPLGVLFNSIGTLGKILPEAGDAATLLTIMREEAQRLERLVRELLDFARPLAPSLEPESLASVVEAAALAAQRELGPDVAPVTLDVGADIPPVRLDASMMRRAIVNLVVNGLQAAGGGGTVLVRTSIATRGGRRFARVDVIDSGPGMKPELTARVFEPFFTTKATGTGLGLPVVKSIVDSHGGEIELDSRPGAGTTVTFYLPLDRDGSERQPAVVRTGGW